MVLTGESTTLGGAREWHEWVELDRYGLDRPAYPSFFATELRALGDSPRIIATRE